MTAIQTQSASPAPIQTDDRVTSWWMTIQYQTSAICQNLANKETGKIYRAALWKTGQILGQFTRLLMLIGLSIVGFFVGLWLICFYKGRQLRQDLEHEPTPQNILWKLISVLIINPVVNFIKWLKISLKREFNCTLPEPPQATLAPDRWRSLSARAEAFAEAKASPTPTERESTLPDSKK
jgi:hypothetical protein